MSYFEQDKQEYSTHLIGKNSASSSLQAQTTTLYHGFQPIVDRITRNIRELQKANFKLKSHEQLVYCKDLGIQCQKDMKELDMFKLKPNDKRAMDDKKRTTKKLKSQFQNEMKRLEQNGKEMSKDIRRKGNEKREGNVNQTITNSTQDTVLDIQKDDEKKPLTDQNQDQQFSLETLKHQQEMLQERESQIKNIEKEIIEINEMMQDTAQLVIEQGENLQLIEDVVEKTQEDTHQGNLEIRKASVYSQQTKKKLVVIFIVFAIIAAIALAMAFVIYK